jgi:uncharacterized membrane protein YecN with MAPEG domain
MSIYLIGVVTIIYLAVSVDLLIKSQIGMSLCFLGYAVANVGLIYSMVKNLN